MIAQVSHKVELPVSEVYAIVALEAETNQIGPYIIPTMGTEYDMVEMEKFCGPAEGAFVVFEVKKPK